MSSHWLRHKKNDTFITFCPFSELLSIFRMFHTPSPPHPPLILYPHPPTPDFSLRPILQYCQLLPHIIIISTFFARLICFTPNYVHNIYSYHFSIFNCKKTKILQKKVRFQNEAKKRKMLFSTLLRCFTVKYVEKNRFLTNSAIFRGQKVETLQKVILQKQVQMG